MKMTKEEYQRYVAQKAQKSPIVKDTACAFLIGGGICVIGQAILNLAKGQGLDQTAAGTVTTICLVGLSALLTGLNLYNKLARFGGAGTLVPVTGFANAVVSPGHRLQGRGLCHRHGGQDVPGGGARAGVRHRGRRDLRRDPAGILSGREMGGAIPPISRTFSPGSVFT